MKKCLGVENFETEIILINLKDKVKAEDDVKIADFCQALVLGYFVKMYEDVKYWNDPDYLFDWTEGEFS